MYVLGQTVALLRGGTAEQNLQTCFVYLPSFSLLLIAEISIFSGNDEVLKNATQLNSLFAAARW